MQETESRETTLKVILISITKRQITRNISTQNQCRLKPFESVNLFSSGENPNLFSHPNGPTILLRNGTVLAIESIPKYSTPTEHSPSFPCYVSLDSKFDSRQGN